ncbi:MAG: hypothetical protein HY039_00605 [Nitrospirae bacterium]|nr:hypothetical protein [Nitrospirota bacterium]
MVFLIALSGCAALTFRKAEREAHEGNWEAAIPKYREAYRADSGNVEYRSRLLQAEEIAGNFFLDRGESLLRGRKLDEALAELQKGLVLSPGNARIEQAILRAVTIKEADSHYREAEALEKAGKSRDAQAKLAVALEKDPSHPGARGLMNRIDQAAAKAAQEGADPLASVKPVTLNFRGADVKTVFEFLGKAAGINVLFDEGVKKQPVTIFLKDIPFSQALRLLLSTNKLFYKKVTANTIIVVSETPQKRAQYEEHMVRSFFLSHARAKDVQNVLKTILDLKKVTIDEPLNVLTVRDTEDKVRLAEKVIETHDRRLAEVMLEVELLEVNRNKLEQLGIDFSPYTIGVGLSRADLGSPTRFANSLQFLINTNALFTIPNATIRLFKSDVDAKTLAHPRVRVLNGKTAKVHIGDRIPLRTSTVTEATGQVRTLYEYKEIGIKLTVEPVVHLTRETSLKMNLEISSLGENLGTPTEPQYRIGTRNAETHLDVRDGETVILGGLIRDEERGTAVKIPLLGDVPVLGRLFTSKEDTRGRTDILLTITPHVVRGVEVPGKDVREFWSGTKDEYGTEGPLGGASGPRAEPPPAAAKGEPARPPGAAPAAPASSRDEAPPGAETASPPAPSPVPGGPGNEAAPADASPPPTGEPPAPSAEAPAAPAAPPAAPAGRAVVEFGTPIHYAEANKEAAVELRGKGLPAGEIPAALIYNPAVVEFIRVEAGTAGTVQAEVGGEAGTVGLKIIRSEGAGDGAIARLVFRGKAAGISHMVFRGGPVVDAEGKPVPIEYRTSRIVVK